MWKIAVPCLAMLVCTVVIVVQRATIINLQRQLHLGSRVKRSADQSENVVFLPIFAQISKKAMHRMCMKRGYTRKETIILDKAIVADVPTAGTSMIATTTRMPKKKKSATSRIREERRRCSNDVTLSNPQVVGVRPNEVGAVLRDGHTYYATEFDLGYSILVFPSARALNNSEPKTIVTLPYPFHGTDNTVHNKTVYYSYDSALISFSMKNGDMKELRLNASLGILYNNSTSRMNIQADEHGLWILYREIGETFLTATRIEPKSLKIVSVRTLLAITPERLCNAFVRCGTLYTVICDVDHVTVAAAYDFHTHMYVNGKQSEWIGITNPSSVQYDPNSKSITVFANGKVYTINAN